MLTAHLGKKTVLNFGAINSLKKCPVSIKDSVNLGEAIFKGGWVYAIALFRLLLKQDRGNTAG